jgi:hypothetical protein
MAKVEPGRKSKAEHDRKSKNEEDRQLSKELEMSFPASGPPAATQPGSGVTGPEAARSEAKSDRMDFPSPLAVARKAPRRHRARRRTSSRAPIISGA